MPSVYVSLVKNISVRSGIPKCPGEVPAGASNGSSCFEDSQVLLVILPDIPHNFSGVPAGTSMEVF